MKTKGPKGHIIAKIVLTIVLAATFVTIGAMIKQIPNSESVKQHEKSLIMPTTTFFDRVDKWFSLTSDKLFDAVKVMSDISVIIYSILISVIIVLLLDLTAGVGRSRTEERLERWKSITSQG